MAKRSKCGVYKIYCTENNKIYIGSTIDHIQRWASHRSMLSKNKHGNRHLQNAYNKFGKESFKYSLLEICKRNELVAKEQFWIDNYEFKELMNSSPTASTSTGFKHSKESRELIRKKAKERKGAKHLKKFLFKKGKKSLFEGKKHSKQAIEKLKKIAANRTWKTGGWNKGISMPDFVKLKVSKSVSLNKRVYDDKYEKKAKSLRKKGMTFQKISDELGVSLAQVHRMCNGRRAQVLPQYLSKSNN